MKLDRRIVLGLIIITLYINMDKEDAQNKYLKKVYAQIKKKHLPFMKRDAELYNLHVDISTEAWEKSLKDSTFDMTYTGLISMLLKKNTDIMAYYKIDYKLVDKVLQLSNNIGSYVFRSSKTASIMTEKLNITMAEFNYRINND